MRTRNDTDVVVVGAGVTGMSIAWHLSRRGIRCTVVERKHVGSGMTSVQAGGVRTQWSSRLTCRLAIESRAFYEDIDRHLAPSVSPRFQACGSAFLARTEEALATIGERVDLQQAEGVKTRMVCPDELTRLVPGLRAGRFVGGAFNPVDGYFSHPMAVVEAFAQAATQAGQVLVHANADRLAPSGNGWRVELSDGSSVTAADVVIAAGCDTPDLLAGVGVQIPVRRVPRFLFYTPPVPAGSVPSLVVFEDDSLVTKQLADGRVFGADLRYGVNGVRPGEDSFGQLEEGLRRGLTLPDELHFTSVVEGEYDTTPDQQLLTGPVPERPGLWMAVGFQGRGMMLAPAVGRMMAEAVTSGWSDLADAVPEELSPARFGAGWASDFEAQVI